MCNAASPPRAVHVCVRVRVRARGLCFGALFVVELGRGDVPAFREREQTKHQPERADHERGLSDDPQRGHARAVVGVQEVVHLQAQSRRRCGTG
jgi:hypothetical protein